ncbi:MULTISPECIES: CDP-glycerol glycerophosphotransferase family protein [unclassified Shewanella]|uniref:CDP-glycerol glycerophosphotransferase family protein n=1 Tax=unclassified Shewanella TaxID=196818 RepID=UPI0021803D04|nr:MULTISPECIES: CDP-glycerol glycerophosphotransferase family protein [unclassified Shewanella]
MANWAKVIIRKLVYTLAALSPRSSSKALFGSYKEGFSDNSKYLYLHWQQTKYIRCIWISGNREIIEQLQNQDFEVYYRWSLKGVYHALTTKYYFYNSYIGDINQWLANGSTKVNLWHGLPMKKIEFDINTGPMAQVFNPEGKLALCKQWLFAHQQRITPDLMLSPSTLIDSLFSSAFRLNDSNTQLAEDSNYDKADGSDVHAAEGSDYHNADGSVTSGTKLLRATNPRTDYYALDTSKRQPLDKIFSSITQENMQPNSNDAFEQAATFTPIPTPTPTPTPSIILYTPSWRDSHKQGNPYSSAFDWQQLSNHLVANNQLFLLRLHPNEASLADELTEYANIINISHLGDVYGFLQQVDLLITDYSSLFIDALPLNTPICFYRFDEAHYQQDCRNIYDYATKLPDIAPKCTNFDELLQQLTPVKIAKQKPDCGDRYQKDQQNNDQENYQENYLEEYQNVSELFWGKDTPNAFEALEGWVDKRRT